MGGGGEESLEVTLFVLALKEHQITLLAKARHMSSFMMVIANEN